MQKYKYYLYVRDEHVEMSERKNSCFISDI